MPSRRHTSVNAASPIRMALPPAFSMASCAVFGELVRVDGDGGLDLAVVEHLDQAALLAQQAERDDVLEGELGAGLGGDDLGDAVEAEDLVLDAEDVGEAALGQTAVKGHLAAFEAAHEATNPSGSPGPCGRGWRSCPCPSPYRGRHASCFRSPSWGRGDWRDCGLPFCFLAITPAARWLSRLAFSRASCAR